MNRRLYSASASVLLLLLLGACYRPSTAQLTLELPEAEGNPTELDAVRRALLSEEDRLREGLRLYRDIRVLPEASALEITYNRRYLADMNLIHRVNALGYQVADLPGDSAKRAEFLKMQLP